MSTVAVVTGMDFRDEAPPSGQATVPAGAAERIPPGTRRLSLLALFLGAFAVGTDGFMIAGLLPAIAEEFHTSTPTAAQLVTVFSIGYALGAPVLASLLHRVDRRTLLGIGLLGLAVTNAAAALAPVFAVLFVARLAAALAAGVYSPTAAVVAAGMAEANKRGRALSVITAGLTLSIVTGVPLGNVIGESWGWRTTFGGVAALSVVLAVVLYAILPALPAGRAAVGVRDRLAAFRSPGVRRVLVTTLLGILAGYLGYTFVAPVSQAMGARGDGELAIVLVCFGVGAAIGSTLAGLGVDRYRQVTVVRAGALVQAISLALATGFVVAAPAFGVWPSAVVFGLLGIGSWGYNAPQQHRLVELAPDSATVVVSLNSSAIYAGIGLSGALGALTSVIGSSTGVAGGGPALTCVLGVLLALVTMIVVGGRGRSTQGAH